MKRFISILLGTFTCGAVANAHEEVPISYSAEGSVIYINKTSMKSFLNDQDHVNITATFSEDHSRDRSVPHSKTVTREIFNCDQRTQALSEIIMFDDVEAVVLHEEFDELQFYPIETGSVGEIKLQFVCTTT